MMKIIMSPFENCTVDCGNRVGMILHLLCIYWWKRKSEKTKADLGYQSPTTKRFVSYNKDSFLNQSTSKSIMFFYTLFYNHTLFLKKTLHSHLAAPWWKLLIFLSCRFRSITSKSGQRNAWRTQTRNGRAILDPEARRRFTFAARYGDWGIFLGCWDGAVEMLDRCRKLGFIPCCRHYQPQVINLSLFRDTVSFDLFAFIHFINKLLIFLFSVFPLKSFCKSSSLRDSTWWQRFVV